MTILVPSFSNGSGNKVNHKSLDGFEFGQDSFTDFGVSCP